MKVVFTKQFNKQLDKIQDASSKIAIRESIKQLIDANTLKDVTHVKKMKNHKSAYRMHAGNYRIGFYLEKDELLIAAVANRKDIYKRFP